MLAARRSTRCTTYGFNALLIVCNIHERALYDICAQQFKKLDVHGRGELEENEAMMMFERRGSIKTARELRQLVMAMDQNKNHRLSLLEWLCAHFGKSYADLNDFVDEDARARALEEAMLAGEAARKAEEDIKLAEQQKELQASLRAAALERESKLVILSVHYGSIAHVSSWISDFCTLDGCRGHEGILCSPSGECWGRHQDQRATGALHMSVSSASAQT